MTVIFRLWVITKVSIAEGSELSEHIKHFQNMLIDKMEIIEKLKSYYNFECIFYVILETEDAGIGFDLDESQLSFINKKPTGLHARLLLTRK